MGLSSAMNQMGGVVATLIAGVLAAVSWRASFLVYLMGLISIVLCLLFLPNEKIGSQDGKRESGSFKKYYTFVIAMFLLMFTFFVYPSSFAIQTAKEGIIPMQYVSIIMAAMDLIAFFGGLAFVHIKKHFGMATKFIAPALFFVGYLLLFVFGGWIGAIFGSACIGFANGLGIPFLMSTAGQTAGRAAATTVMPLLSMAMYLAQFLTPMILSAAGNIPPYAVAACSAGLFVLWSSTIKGASTPKEAVIQEK